MVVRQVVVFDAVGTELGRQAPPHDPRGAPANVAYVEDLVARGAVPFSEHVEQVRAEGDVLVVDTNLTDVNAARGLWSAIASSLKCDDSFLRIANHHIVLLDGTRITQGSLACR